MLHVFICSHRRRKHPGRPNAVLVTMLYHRLSCHPEEIADDTLERVYTSLDPVVSPKITVMVRHQRQQVAARTVNPGFLQSSA